MSQTKAFQPRTSGPRIVLELAGGALLTIAAPLATFLLILSFLRPLGIAPAALVLVRAALALVATAAFVLVLRQIVGYLCWSELRILPDRLEQTGLWTAVIPARDLARATIVCEDLRRPSRVILEGSDEKIELGPRWPLDRIATTLRRSVAPAIARGLARRLVAGEALTFAEPARFGSVARLVASCLALSPVRGVRRFLVARRGGIVLTALGIRSPGAKKARPLAQVTGVHVGPEGIEIAVAGELIRLSVSGDNYLALLELLPRLLPRSARWTSEPAACDAFDACRAVAPRGPVPLARPVARAA